MIEVKIKLTSYLRIKIGMPVIEMRLEEAPTIIDVVNKLEDIYGSWVRNHFMDKKNGLIVSIFTVNDKRCTTNQILNKDDVIAIFPPLTGG